MTEAKPQVRKRNELIHFLPSTITIEQLKAMKIGAVCELTGSSSDVTVDHFIPVAWGHGGQYTGNLFFVKRKLNVLKSNLNPFKWIKKAALSEDLNLTKWDRLVRRLAEENELSVKEFRRYVNWCEKHKRTKEQLLADRRPSLVLWLEDSAQH
ncbi:hypothetical protein [Cohnella candidum]|uniref:HNH endonuclease n=1 Tax=Cohnella candidum TaxID=2674991 RepID=A0A3G3JVE1_9BACL|nr:hypothetical protein [Cohnella candidum]AYQ72210.1 hypothetical protein EAV92_06275 [Cohnella candidum]